MYELLNAYLENGLRIILHKIADARTVSCGLWVGQGSSNETDDNNGLSHLAEHLLLNPEAVDNNEYVDVMEKAVSFGAIYNAATTKEYTCFHFTSMTNALDVCLSALACIAMDNRSFPKERFENEKKVVLQEATGFYSSFQQIKERTSHAIWGNMGTGRIIMGDMRNISNAVPEQIEEILEKGYHPSNAIVVVIGGIDYNETLKMIECKFCEWGYVHDEYGEDVVESEPGIYVNHGSGTSTVFSIGFRTPGYSEKSRPAVEMMSRILGQSGLQSRMAQEIRMKRGLSYSLGSFSSFYKKRGTLGFMVVCDNEKVIDAAAVLMEVLNEARIRGFSEEEIEREKNMMETALLLSVDNITEHLRHIGKCSMMDHSFYIEQELRAVRDIGREDVEQMANDLLRNSNMGLAVIGQCNTDEIFRVVEFGEEG